MRVRKPYGLWTPENLLPRQQKVYWKLLNCKCGQGRAWSSYIKPENWSWVQDTKDFSTDSLVSFEDKFATQSVLSFHISCILMLYQTVCSPIRAGAICYGFLICILGHSSSFRCSSAVIWTVTRTRKLYLIQTIFWWQKASKFVI